RSCREVQRSAADARVAGEHGRKRERSLSTYSDSKYVRARKEYGCAQCSAVIQTGESHLAYKPGLRSTIRVCSGCSRSATDGQNLRWWCHAVEQAIAGAAS